MDNAHYIEVALTIVVGVVTVGSLIGLAFSLF